jgi:hypothetical protein
MNAHTVARRLAVVAVAFAALVLSSCAAPAVIAKYQSGAGTQGTVGVMELRDVLIVVAEDGTGSLSGAMISRDRDSLESITGGALQSNLTQGKALTIKSDVVTIPSSTLVKFANTSITGDGLTPGMYAEITFIFTQSGSITLQVPIIPTNWKGYDSPAP